MNLVFSASEFLKQNDIAGIAGATALLASERRRRLKYRRLMAKQITDDVYNLFIEMRYQKPASQVAPAERAEMARRNARRHLSP